MTGTYTANIKKSYVELRSLYLGADARRDGKLQAGKLTVLLEGDDDFSVDGKLDAGGFLTRMAKLYHRLGLKDGMRVEYSVNNDGDVVIHSPPTTKTAYSPGAEEQERVPGVFERQKLRHVHLEPFRPESLNSWDPETETDVYLAFGVLQDYTDYQYCCGTTQAVLDRLGASYSGTSKPDAILIDRTTGQYVMAEWKKHSSDFKSNHKPEDVDVLVCWHDNEIDRTQLPPKTLALHAIAKKAAQIALDG